MNMMKWKIGAVLILLILFLPMITNANAEETTKGYSMSDIIAFKKQGWEASTDIRFDIPTQRKFGDGGIVGKNIMIEGGASVSLTKNNQTLYGHIIYSDGPAYYFLIQICKEDAVVEVLGAIPDDNGNFNVDFTPKEPGYYVIDWKSGYDWLPIENAPGFFGSPLYFHVSEKDSDGDGVPDQYDYDPYDLNVQTKSDIETPGFEAIFVIAGLLVVMYLLRRRK